MNPEFIEKNQIVERYLAGKLPFQGRQDFERYCRENPDVLEDIQLADRLHSPSTAWLWQSEEVELAPIARIGHYHAFEVELSPP